MPRSHPPSLLTLTRRTLTRDALFPPQALVLVAVSGGPDSMALLHVLARLRASLGHRLVAHGVDHGLRADAQRELGLAADFAQSLEVPFERTRVHLDAGGNLQARARTARYEALRAAASRAGASRIATAHHATDRAETVLLRLLRGAGPRGLAVLPSRAGDLVRPFIDAPREAIDAHVARHSIPFSVDPSNRDPRFLRARVRHELLPLLRALSPRIDEHLCALAAQLGSAVQAAEATAGAGEFGSPGRPPLTRATREALDALVRAASPRARVALKNGLVARWDAASRTLVVEAEDAAPDTPDDAPDPGERPDQLRKKKQKEQGAPLSPWRARKSSPRSRKD